MQRIIMSNSILQSDWLRYTPGNLLICLCNKKKQDGGRKAKRFNKPGGNGKCSIV